jgi:hypothetical protein
LEEEKKRKRKGKERNNMVESGAIPVLRGGRSRYQVPAGEDLPARSNVIP